MKIKEDRENGFSSILIILFALLVTGVVGFIGWQLYSRQLHGTSQQSSSQQSITYAGWQTFCSSTGGICFKYPSNWKKTETSGSNPASTITIASPTKTVEVVYTPHVVGAGGHCNPSTCFFTAESMTPLSSLQAAGFTVLKGVYTNKDTGAVLAYYFLGSDDKLAPYNLKVNQRIDVGFFADLFTSPLDRSAIEELRVKSVPDNGFASEAAAHGWLSDPEVATAGNILTSVYLNKSNH